MEEENQRFSLANKHWCLCHEKNKIYKNNQKITISTFTIHLQITFCMCYWDDNYVLWPNQNVGSVSWCITFLLYVFGFFSLMTHLRYTHLQLPSSPKVRVRAVHSVLTVVWQLRFCCETNWQCTVDDFWTAPLKHGAIMCSCLWAAATLTQVM